MGRNVEKNLLTEQIHLWGPLFMHHPEEAAFIISVGKVSLVWTMSKIFLKWYLAKILRPSIKIEILQWL